MPTLQVRDFPQDVYDALVTLAERDHRSVAQEAVVIIRDGVKMKDDPRARRLAALASLPDLKLPKGKKFPSAAKLIREDRDR